MAPELAHGWVGRKELRGAAGGMLETDQPEAFTMAGIEANRAGVVEPIERGIIQRLTIGWPPDDSIGDTEGLDLIVQGLDKGIASQGLVEAQSDRGRLEAGETRKALQG